MQGMRYTPYISLIPFVLWSVFNIIGPLVYAGLGTFKYTLLANVISNNDSVAAGLFAPHVYSLLLWSLLIIFVLSIFTAILATSMGYLLLFLSNKWKAIILVMLIVNAQVPFVARIFAWKLMLSDNGVLMSSIMHILKSMHILGPYEMLGCSSFACLFVMTNVLFFLSMLPVYAATVQFPSNTLDAALDLGAGHFRVFRSIYIPMIGSSIGDAYRVALVISSGSYVIFDIMGGSGEPSLGVFLADIFWIFGNDPVVFMYNIIACISMVLMFWFPDIVTVVLSAIAHVRQGSVRRGDYV